MQNFDLQLADPSYELKIAESLTIKPADFYIKARLRHNMDPVMLLKSLHGGHIADSTKRDSVPESDAKDTVANTSAEPLTILFGSSAGTCEGLAHSLASAARSRGFEPTVQSLDEAVGIIAKGPPVIIVACTYEGQAPDNAKAFLQWLQGADAAQINGIKFAVFGCGHRDWVSTYQKVPQIIERELTSKGAIPLLPRGESDVSQGTIFDDFDAWSDQLWKTLSAGVEQQGCESSLEISLDTTSRASNLRYKLQDATILTNERITHAEAPEKRHITLQLPADMQYEAGDYLAVLPLNNEKAISRVLRRFELPWDTNITITGGSHATIPTKQALPVVAVLAGYIELSTPATQKHKKLLSKHANHNLEEETGSIIDILERCPDIDIPFSTFLAMHPPLRLRQYSISSSPLLDPSIASITFSVLRKGAATSYLKDLEPGSKLQVAVKKSSAAFHLPEDDTVPIIMVAAGAGLAPFRGFLQERAAKAKTQTVGKALLFVGCRRPDHDRLFSDELDIWERDGIVEVFYAYSQASEQSAGCKYVQDRLWQERERIGKVFDEGARAYICGSSAVGRAVGDVAVRIIRERDGESMSEDEARTMWEQWRGERYAVDVFD